MISVRGGELVAIGECAILQMAEGGLPFPFQSLRELEQAAGVSGLEQGRLAREGVMERGGVADLGVFDFGMADGENQFAFDPGRLHFTDKPGDGAARNSGLRVPFLPV
jgi:hypothetical protein